MGVWQGEQRDGNPSPTLLSISEALGQADGRYLWVQHGVCGNVARCQTLQKDRRTVQQRLFTRRHAITVARSGRLVHAARVEGWGTEGSTSSSSWCVCVARTGVGHANPKHANRSRRRYVAPCVAARARGCPEASSSLCTRSSGSIGTRGRAQSNAARVRIRATPPKRCSSAHRCRGAVEADRPRHVKP